MPVSIPQKLAAHPHLFLRGSTLLLLVIALVSTQTGCGTTKSSLATEQLLLSDAVDRSISAIDFRPLCGRTVFFDTQFVPTQKTLPPNLPADRNYVNANYVLSSLRQQILAAGCRLVDKEDLADVIVEPRIGTMASDAHLMSVGIPASQGISTAASAVSGIPAIPAIPELSLARRETQDAAAKIAVFAYDQKTREPIWQSGLSLAQSTGRDTWVFGVGPFHRSSVRKGELLVGPDSNQSRVQELVQEESKGRPPVDYDVSMLFQGGWPVGTGVSQKNVSTETPRNAQVEAIENNTDHRKINPPPVVRASAKQTTGAEPEVQQAVPKTSLPQRLPAVAK